MTIKDGKKVIESYIEKNFKTKSHAICGFTVKDGFVYSVRPDDWDDKEILADPYFKVSNTGKVTEYSPVMDPKEFREGQKHLVKF